MKYLKLTLLPILFLFFTSCPVTKKYALADCLKNLDNSIKCEDTRYSPKLSLKFFIKNLDPNTFKDETSFYLYTTKLDMSSPNYSKEVFDNNYYIVSKTNSNKSYSVSLDKLESSLQNKNIEIWNDIYRCSSINDQLNCSANKPKFESINYSSADCFVDKDGKVNCKQNLSDILELATGIKVGTPTASCLPEDPYSFRIFSRTEDGNSLIEYLYQNPNSVKILGDPAIEGNYMEVNDLKLKSVPGVDFSEPSKKYLFELFSPTSPNSKIAQLYKLTEPK